MSRLALTQAGLAVSEQAPEELLDNRSGVESATSEVSWEAVDEGETRPTLWVPDHAASACMGCHTQFWFGRRKHHCRSCGRLFCSECSERSVPIPAEQLYTPVRVCDACYDDLTVAGATGDRPPATHWSDEKIREPPPLDIAREAIREGIKSMEKTRETASHELAVARVSPSALLPQQPLLCSTPSAVASLSTTVIHSSTCSTQPAFTSSSSTTSDDSRQDGRLAQISGISESGRSSAATTAVENDKDELSVSGADTAAICDNLEVKSSVEVDSVA